MRKGRTQQHLIIELVAQNFLGARKSFRQSQDLSLPGVFDRVDGVGDRVKREQSLVIDLEVELVLDGRNQLQTLERVGIEVVKGGLIANFGNIDARTSAATSAILSKISERSIALPLIVHEYQKNGTARAVPRHGSDSTPRRAPQDA